MVRLKTGFAYRTELAELPARFWSALARAGARARPVARALGLVPCRTARSTPVNGERERSVRTWGDARGVRGAAVARQAGKAAVAAAGAALAAPVPGAHDAVAARAREVVALAVLAADRLLRVRPGVALALAADAVRTAA